MSNRVHAAAAGERAESPVVVRLFMNGATGQPRLAGPVEQAMDDAGTQSPRR